MSTTILTIPVASACTKAAPPSVWLRLRAGLERHGRRRAALELRRLAALHAFGDPVLARQLLAAAASTERG
jgi:hypothetical protein